VILLGPDLKEELPVLYLRLRDAAEKRRTRLAEVSPRETGLSRYTWQRVTAQPGTQAAAVSELLGRADVAEQLGRGDVVVVVGRSNLAEAPEHTLVALQAVLNAVPGAKVLPVLRRGNVRGALAAGLAPVNGFGTREILESAAAGRIGCLVLLGADPVGDVPDTELARRAVAAARRVIAVDTFLTSSSEQADVVLPAAAFAEKAGTTTNLEGRVTALGQRVTSPGTARPDWMIAVELASRLGHDLGIGSLTDVQTSLATHHPAFASVFADLHGAPDGVLLAGADDPAALADVAAPSVPERNSYDYRLIVGRKLYDRAVGTQRSPSLAGLAPGARLHVHPLDLDRLGASEGSEVKVSGPKGTVIMPVTADAGVARGSVWAACNQDGPDIAVLIDARASIVDVRVESLS
jgi:NADH-quinone oxidoreductase subunit G